MLAPTRNFPRTVNVGAFYSCRILIKLLGPVSCKRVLASVPAHYTFYMRGAFIVAGGGAISLVRC